MRIADDAIPNNDNEERKFTASLGGWKEILEK